MKNEQQKGIWIPTEILEDNRLDLTEKVILAIYKYYTVDGDAHCCFLTNDKIAEMIGESKRTIQRVKKNLKELNLIDSDGGIRTWYTGGGDKLTQGGDKLTPQGRQIDTPGGDKMAPKIKNKIKKNKKENKDTYNISTIEHNSNTSNISTSKGDYDDEDLEYMERYGIGKLSYILQNNDDWLPAMEYLQKHPTKNNYDKIEAYWSDNEEYLECLHNFNNNTLRITV